MKQLLKQLENYNQNKGVYMQDQNETTQTETKSLIIKKYRNRKFYDTELSQYVTLGAIQNAVKSGRSVMVIDNVTKRDITAKTLLMSLVETEGEREDLSLEQVTELVKKGLVSK